MAQPTRAQIHVDSFLTDMSVAMFQNPANFIAGQVFQDVSVKKQSDLYAIYDMADFRRDAAEKRAPATESVGGGYRVSNEQYFCEKYAYHKDVTEEDRVNSDQPLDADRDAVDFVMQKMLILKERIWRDNFFTTGIWDTDLVGGVDFTVWDNAASTPIKDISDAQMVVGALTGLKMNTLVLSPPVRAVLNDNPDVLERIQYGGTPGAPAVVTDSALAQCFGVDRILVPWGVINTAAEGATEYTDFIFGKDAMLCYTEPGTGKKKPTAGRTFHWTGLLGSGAMGVRVNRLPMDLLGLGTERIEAEVAFVMKAISTVLGTFFDGVVT